MLNLSVRVVTTDVERHNQDIVENSP